MSNAGGGRERLAQGECGNEGRQGMGKDVRAGVLAPKM